VIIGSMGDRRRARPEEMGRCRRKKLECDVELERIDKYALMAAVYP